VIGGQPDSADHPYVAFMRYKPSPTSGSIVCSAVAVDATHLVTAAHCAPNGGQVKVLFDPVVQPGTPSAFDGPNAIGGTFYAIPGSCFGCAPEGQPDLAVVVLERAAPITEFATLARSAPAAKADVTVVGYGAADIKGGSHQQAAGVGVRRSVDTRLIPFNGSASDRFLKVSSSQGGACVADSGGFVGIGDTLYAVVSSGSQMCGGNGLAYKVFTAEARAFLAGFGL
jgi:secreted trypsin-like serine protease